MNEKTELVTTTTMPMDGIDGYTDATIGEETKQSGLFPGTRIKFSRESEWEINDEPLDPALRLLLNDVKRIITRWGHDKKPAEKPVEKFGGWPSDRGQQPHKDQHWLGREAADLETVSSSLATGSRPRTPWSIWRHASPAPTDPR